jgi:protein involved in polysaccharide export with SLBB domain
MQSRLLSPLFALALLLAGAAHAQQQCPPGMYCPPAATGIFDQGVGGVQTPSGTYQQGPQQPLGVPTITNRGVTVPQGTPSGIPGATPGAFPSRDAFRVQPQFAEPEALNEFQDFLFASTGRILPIFGRNLFEDVPSTFAPVENIPVTSDYVIGPGDELYIRAWGSVDIDYRATVDRNGTIAIPRVGVVNVSGIRFQDLTAYMKNAVSRVFRGFELTVSMGQLRSIQIFVVGQARKPGSYTVSSLSTLVNAVFAAGGPSNRGSMRSVQLKRGNKTVADLDLYELLLYGDKSKDVPLLPGDVIYFAPIGSLAAISGSVNTSAIFELKGEASLSKLLEWSGGLTSTAQTRVATIERIDTRRTRVVNQFSLDTAGLGQAIKDGDLVTVLPILPKFENAVTLRGNVAFPLRYPHKPGMRVKDLIPEREALIRPDYYLKKNLATRQEATGEARRGTFAQQQGAFPQRQQGVFPQQQGAFPQQQQGAFAQQQQGAFPQQQQGTFPQQQQPGAFPQQQPGMVPERRLARGEGEERIRTQVKNLLDEINWDYAVVERLNQADLSTLLLPFNLARAILDGDPVHNLLLEPGDVVTVFSKTDINVPQLKQTRLVRLEGEFMHSGVYQAQPGETLRQLVARAGGLTPAAYLFGADFTRESTRKAQETQYQESLDRLERESESIGTVQARSVLSAEEAQALPAQAAARRALIARLRELRPTGRIVLEVPTNGRAANLPDVPLEDGDRLYVPSPPSMVSVYGAVFTESSFLYRPEKRVTDYLTQAGGATKRADTSQLFVLRADGSVAGSSRGWFGTQLASSAIMPGDTIVVPEDFERTTWMKDLKDWAQIFYQFSLGVAAIKVLRE